MYFVKSQSLDQEFIDKITTSVKLKKYVAEKIENWGGIGHVNMSNYDDSMKVYILDNNPEDSEHMKDIDDNIIDETQGNNLKWNLIMMMTMT